MEAEPWRWKKSFSLAIKGEKREESLIIVICLVRGRSRDRSATPSESFKLICQEVKEEEENTVGGMRAFGKC